LPVGDGRHRRLLRSIGRVDLLILDDWGLDPLDAAARHDLLEILEERYPNFPNWEKKANNINAGIAEVSTT